MLRVSILLAVLASQIPAWASDPPVSAPRKGLDPISVWLVVSGEDTLVPRFEKQLGRELAKVEDIRAGGPDSLYVIDVIVQDIELQDGQVIGYNVSAAINSRLPARAIRVLTRELQPEATRAAIAGLTDNNGVMVHHFLIHIPRGQVNSGCRRLIEAINREVLSFAGKVRRVLQAVPAAEGP